MHVQSHYLCHGSLFVPGTFGPGHVLKLPTLLCFFLLPGLVSLLTCPWQLHVSVLLLPAPVIGVFGGVLFWGVLPPPYHPLFPPPGWAAQCIWGCPSVTSGLVYLKWTASGVPTHCGQTSWLVCCDWAGM